MVIKILIKHKKCRKKENTKPKNFDQKVTNNSLEGYNKKLKDTPTKNAYPEEPESESDDEGQDLIDC
ncbi:hypothetical protein BpHYR1_015139 [Brachionus plicatilis]|uniref:Uncharacterized protein n=1 Tax=Brachionus plicatilis TaxID=10195 RepID=A0A3M7T6D7_BRAPC|nr:hypothetical protein BpHYR1_015139 [Brachionus plicatilis]